MSYLASIFSEQDRRLLVILVIFLIVIFLLAGLIGMLMRLYTMKSGKRMDYELHDVCIYRVVTTPEELKRYGHKKNVRKFFKDAIAPISIAFVSIVFYLIYAGVTNGWGRNWFGEFGTVFYQWDFSDPESYANFWGLTLLSRWPPLVSSPHFNPSYWASYILVPMWLVSIVYFLIVAWAFLSRSLLVNKRGHTVFEKSLEDFNFYDNVKGSDVENPVRKSAGGE